MLWFPKEILEEILSRLPVKCLLRLRCVSKSWLALIDDPCFVKLHLKRSAQTKTNRSLFMSSQNLVYGVDFDSLYDGVIEPAVVHHHPLHSEKGHIIWGSCDGLICISYSEDNVFLWNPSTRKSLKLPHEPVELPIKSNRKPESRYAIGYTCNDYKVVRTVDVFDPNGYFFDYEIMIYSLNSNSWHKLKKFTLFPGRNRILGNVLVGGAIHWIFDMGTEGQEKYRIVAIDLGTEEYRFIPDPEYHGPLVETCLYNYFEGCLSLSCEYIDSMTTDIWLLKEYGGKNEHWMRLIIMFPLIPRYTGLIRNAYNSKCGKKVLVVMNCKKLFWYNLEQKSIEDIMIHGMDQRNDLVVELTCMESLVSVDVTAAIANDKSPQEDEKNRQCNLEQTMNSDRKRIKLY